MKTVEIVPRRGRRRTRKNDGEVNLTKVYGKHIYKYHQCIPLYNYYMLIKILK
jgi:hypothetical protein